MSGEDLEPEQTSLLCSFTLCLHRQDQGSERASCLLFPFQRGDHQNFSRKCSFLSESVITSPSVVHGISPKIREKWEFCKNRRVIYFTEKLVTEKNILLWSRVERIYITFESHSSGRRTKINCLSGAELHMSLCCWMILKISLEHVTLSNQ